jgi:hypothetical protein
MIGLSNVPLSTFQSTSQTTLSGGLINNNPTPGLFDSSLNNFFAGRALTRNGNVQTLAYPLDTPKYIITFTTSEYTRNGLSSVGTFQDSGYPGIVLPLPRELINNDSVDWHEVEVGTMPGVALNAAFGSGSNANLGPGLTAEGVDSALIAVQNLSFGVLGNVAGGVRALAGFSPNQFVTMLMRGPQYKRHAFTWELSPTNFKEADVLRQIIRVFRNAMAPNTFGAVGGAPILWTFPKIFYIRLYPNSKFLYKFKPCVCDHFVVNYAPGGRPAFDKNGKNGTPGENPPAQVQITAHFIELEYWIEGNVTDSNDPDDVHTQAVNNTNPLDNLGLTNALNNLRTLLANPNLNATQRAGVQALITGFETLQ